MSVYMQSTAELRSDDPTRSGSAMRKLVAAATAEEWYPVTASEQISGPLSAAADVWRLPDLHPYQCGLTAPRRHDRFPNPQVALEAAIDRETVACDLRAAWIPVGG